MNEGIGLKQKQLIISLLVSSYFFSTKSLSTRSAAPLINVAIADKQEKYGYPHDIERDAGQEVQHVVIRECPRKYVQRERKCQHDGNQHCQEESLMIELGVGANCILGLSDKLVDAQLSLHQQGETGQHQD